MGIRYTLVDYELFFFPSFFLLLIYGYEEVGMESGSLLGAEGNNRVHALDS